MLQLGFQMMEEKIIDLSISDQVEPWCSTCSEFSDYRRKWNTYPRADLDGGTYSENIEIAHCIECGCVMHYLRDCRLLTWGFRLVGLTIFMMSSLLLFGLYELSWATFIIWIATIFVAIMLCKIPVSSRKALSTYLLYLKQSK